jgi:hypothetical protein
MRDSVSSGSLKHPSNSKILGFSRVDGDVQLPEGIEFSPVERERDEGSSHLHEAIDSLKRRIEAADLKINPS